MDVTLWHCWAGRTAAVAALFGGLWASLHPAEGGTEPGAAAGNARADMPFTYVGTKKCRMCHTTQHESWKNSPKGRSWNALMPGVNAELKSRAGLDPSKDYTAESECLACHSVGFGRPGGFTPPDPTDGRAVRAAAAREGAGCESCHGPGSGFVKIMEELYRTGRRPDPAELRAAGRHSVTQQVCNECHNERALCMLVDAADGSRKPAKDLRVDLHDRRGYHEKAPVVRRPAVPRDPSDDEE